MYKVTNESDKPIRQEYSLDLITDKELAEYEAFKQTPDYLGNDDEEKAQRAKLAEVHKFKEWIQRKGMELENAVIVNVARKVMISKDQSVKQTFPEFWHELKAKDSIICNDRQVKGFRRYEISKIEQKIKYGQLKPDVHTSGLVTIERYTPEEVRAGTSDSDFNGYVKEPEALNPKENGLSKLTRTELMELAKTRGIPANLKTEELINRLTEVMK